MEPLAFLEFIRLVIAGDLGEVSRQLRKSTTLATTALSVGATRANASDFFFTEISHYIYGGDTALHMAAAAFSCPMAEVLISNGADCRAKNRRGAEPLHYACDGSGADSRIQAKVIKYLVSFGADPNAVDNSGVAPLHRAVRSRSHAAVCALLDAGANLRQPNNSGSTPLHLAVQTTGASGIGSDKAKQQGEMIIRLLMERGASLSDKDSKGKTVKQAATSTWIRKLLAEIQAN